MFDIGWGEMLVIGIVLIVVVGPKDLPRVLRAFGKTTKKMRSMAGDFQRQFNQAMDEAELSELKKDVNDLRSLNPKSQIQKHLNPLREAADDLRRTVETPGKTAVPSEPAKGAVDGDLLDDPLVKAAEQTSQDKGAAVAPASAVAVSSPAFVPAEAPKAKPSASDMALVKDPAAPPVASKPRVRKAAEQKASSAAKLKTKAAVKPAPAAKTATDEKPAKPRTMKKKPTSQTDENQ